MWGVVKPKLDPWAWVKEIIPVGFSKSGYAVFDHCGTITRLCYSDQIIVGDKVPFLASSFSASFEAECYDSIGGTPVFDSYYIAYNTLKKRFEVYRKFGTYISKGYGEYSVTYHAYHLKKKRGVFEKWREYDFTFTIPYTEIINPEVCQGSYYSLHGMANAMNITYPPNIVHIYLKQVLCGNQDITDLPGITWHIHIPQGNYVYPGLDGYSTSPPSRYYPLTVTVTFVCREV